MSAAGWRDFDMDQSWIPVQQGLFHYPLANGERPALFANHCGNCGKTFFPKRAICPRCFGEGALEDITLDRRGIIYASTVIRIPSPVGIKAPYACGYVDILTNGIRVFALFTGSDPSSFAPGQEVELVVEPVRVDHQGQTVIGYKFKPIGDEIERMRQP